MSSQERDVLSSNIKPFHYQLDIYNVEFGGDFNYSGTVAIGLSISKPTHTIVLNAKQLRLKSASISGQDASEISYNEKLERASITFPSSIAASDKATLLIKFDGTINNDMSGFYRSKYKPIGTPAKSVAKEGDFHLMYSTQFESCDARRAFPCFDEPNLKATFAFSIEIPDDLTTLSNMNQIEVKSGPKPGLKVVSFEKSPKMSTYLYAWAVADFEYVETFTERKYDGKPMPVRVYTTPGYKDQSRLSLDVCAKVVDYYSEIFQINYPLPKVDLVAVHEFSYGAMENWGLITYRLTAILFDEKTSDAQYRKRVSYVVAHGENVKQVLVLSETHEEIELAHQWFGNLVTMDWWSELWLNEGFATWVGWLAIDHFFPAFETWSQFVAEDLQTAQELDGLRSSHAVEVEVRRAEEVEQIFDAISYRKGSSVIRMLVAHLGLNDFLSGIAAYLKKHAYGNATTNDLWAALAASSGKDVKTFMDPWIRKIGFPVLTVAEEPGQIGIKQSRFLSSGDVKDEDDKTIWWIPLGLEPAAASSDDTITQLTTKEETLRNVDEAFYKLNRNQVGFYRTNYPPARLAKLGAERSRLSVEDRIGLIADAAAMALAGHGTTAGLLTLLENFREEDSYAVWSQISASLADVRIIFSENDSLAKALDAYCLRLYSLAVEKIGWQFAKNESFLVGQLRALLIWNAGRIGHESTVDEAKRQFASYAGGNKDTIHPSLRSAIFRINVKFGGQAEYETIKQEFRQTASIDGKEVCLRSLGTAPTAELATDLLHFIFSDEVAVQDLHFGAVSLGVNTVGRKALWDFIVNEWDTVWAKMSSRPIVMARFIKLTLSEFASHEMESKISDFFKDKDQAGWDRAVSQVIDTVKTKAKYRERDEQLLLEWLKAHGYAS